MLTTLRAANLGLAFAIEVAMLLGLALAGWAVGSPQWLRLALAIGLPVVAIGLWALWAAPKAGKRRLKMPALMLFKLAMFAAGAVAWWLAGQAFIASVFAVLAAIHVLGMLAFRQF